MLQRRAVVAPRRAVVLLRRDVIGEVVVCRVTVRRAVVAVLRIAVWRVALWRERRRWRRVVVMTMGVARVHNGGICGRQTQVIVVAGRGRPLRWGVMTRGRGRAGTNADRRQLTVGDRAARWRGWRVVGRAKLGHDRRRRLSVRVSCIERMHLRDRRRGGIGAGVCPAAPYQVASEALGAELRLARFLVYKSFQHNR